MNVKNLVSLDIEKLSYFYNEKFIFNNININLVSKDICCIYGKNASGKTTICKLLSGLFKSKIGNISLKLNNDFISNQLIKYSSIYSSFIEYYDDFTVEENLSFILKLNNITDNISEYLTKLELIDYKNELYKNLSTGIKNRLKLLPILFKDKYLIILDEVFANFDLNGIKLVEDLIIKKQEENAIIIISSNIDINKYNLSKINVTKNIILNKRNYHNSN